MKISTAKEFDTKSDALVVGIFEKDNYRTLPLDLASNITLALKREFFQAKYGEIYFARAVSLPYQKVVVLGLGRRDEFTLEKLRKTIGKTIKTLKSHKLETYTTNLAEICATMFDSTQLGRALAEAHLLGDYSFQNYLNKEKQTKPLVSVSLQFTKEDKPFQEGLRVGIIIAESANYVKDMVNEPASVATPVYIEKAARALAAGNTKIKIRVLEREEMKKEGLGSLLGVSQGSTQPPKLIFLEYQGCKGQPTTALVGKGITFDSGGYNLKPTGYLEDMKSDMAGAAAVLGAIRAISRLGLPRNVLGVIPTCENMVSGGAQRPGDIVRAYNGKTIEITNTDAEGRLILADAISYTEAKYKPAVIIDLATLTGACIIALGYHAAAIITKDQALSQDLIQAGEESGDRLWPLPFFDEYQDCMDGTISDLRNTSGKGRGSEAGAITGAVFISKFVDKARWAHIDIAGPAFLADGNGYTQKGATGFGVRLLTYYCMKG